MRQRNQRAPVAPNEVKSKKVIAIFVKNKNTVLVIPLIYIVLPRQQVMWVWAPGIYITNTFIVGNT